MNKRNKKPADLQVESILPGKRDGVYCCLAEKWAFHAGLGPYVKGSPKNRDLSVPSGNPFFYPFILYFSVVPVLTVIV